MARITDERYCISSYAERKKRDAFCVGQRLEVVDGAAVDVDGDLLFQPIRIGIFSWIQLADVILISHTITSNSIEIDVYKRQRRFWLGR